MRNEMQPRRSLMARWLARTLIIVRRRRVGPVDFDSVKYAVVQADVDTSGCMVLHEPAALLEVAKLFIRSGLDVIYGQFLLVVAM